MMTIFSAGENIGSRYQIRRYLAAGGMQEVYVAFDSVLKRDVALKTPKNRHAEKRFERSAIVSAMVNHPNIAKTLDYFVADSRAILIEELIGGKSLYSALEVDFYHFDPYLSAQFGHHVSKGVAATHHVGVIHRDLKPGNIMMEFEDGIYCFKITDFGIAKLAESELDEAHRNEASITGSQTMMGAIPYMAPEMIQGPKNADKPADIWAIGAILYKLVSGDYPFGQGLPAIPLIHVAKLPPKPSSAFHSLQQFSWLNSSLWEIIMKCLNKDPNSRPTADELVSLFGDLCYGVFPREEGKIQKYKIGAKRIGFINGFEGNVFFHKDSFYGKVEDIEVRKRVQFSKHSGTPADRAHPVLPLKEG
jgi:eukaryotic-like serine/threonine-protein kinase